MKVIRNFSGIEQNINSAITVGTFDGVHEGHNNIFRKLTAIAGEKQYKSVVVTFEPHPRKVISPGSEIKLLTTTGEKIRELEKYGIDEVVILNFTHEFSDLSAEEFVKKFLVKKIGISHFVIGHDHKFGKDRIGDENKLRQLGIKYAFEVAAVDAVKFGGETISSTIIRSLLLQGNIEKANKFLGRRYSFSGKIVEGATRGKMLGFATANIDIADDEKLIPKTGVYAVECRLNDEIHYGVMNIGFRPTFEKDGALVVEVHIFEFNRNIYGQQLKIKLLNRLREEKKFNSKEELIYQIEKDKKKAIQIIGAIINN